MYQWSYIKNAALAKLDLNEISAVDQQLVGRFYIYANEVITQICSTVKPKHTFYKITVVEDSEEGNHVGDLIDMPDDFVAFGDDVCYQMIKNGNETYRIELHDNDFTYHGYNQLMFFHTGTFYISYNARWFTLLQTPADTYRLDAPNDVLDCIPSYIASQCYKIDDEYKAATYRNEYEMLLARIDDTNYKDTKTFIIDGGW